MNMHAIKSYVLENKGKCAKTAGIAIILIVVIAVYLNGRLSENTEAIVIEENVGDTVAAEQLPEAVEEKEILIVVDIEGEVNSPGIVSLTAGSRVNDAVEAAGGLTGRADTMGVNLAEKLSDGDKVYIPDKTEKQESTAKQPAGIVTNGAANASSGGASPGAVADGQAAGLININTATSQQLQALSGVGPVTAQKIIDYRESSGGFKKIEDIMKVSGIGTKTFQKFKDKITV